MTINDIIKTELKDNSLIYWENKITNKKSELILIPKSKDFLYELLNVINSEKEKSKFSNEILKSDLFLDFETNEIKKQSYSLDVCSAPDLQPKNK